MNFAGPRVNITRISIGNRSRCTILKIVLQQSFLEYIGLNFLATTTTVQKYRPATVLYLVLIHSLWCFWIKKVPKLALPCLQHYDLFRDSVPINLKGDPQFNALLHLNDMRSHI